METKTLSELDNYLNQIEPELKAIQEKLNINLDPKIEDEDTRDISEEDINKLVEIFETINDKFSNIEIDDDTEEENN